MNPLTTQMQADELLKTAKAVDEVFRTYVKDFTSLSFHPLVVKPDNITIHVAETFPQLQLLSQLVAKAEEQLGKTKAEGERIIKVRELKLKHHRALAYNAYLAENPGTKVTDTTRFCDSQPNLIQEEEQLAQAVYEVELKNNAAKADVAILKGMLYAMQAKVQVLAGEQNHRNLIMKMGD